jgi:D-glycero-D-manno-heptose 1,7-bisphosphate phosphatase
MRPAVFLDRDDTLMAANSLPPPPPPAAPGDVIDPNLVELLPGVLAGCRDLKEAGFILVVITNQGVVARGGATIQTVQLINERLRTLLLDELGARLITAVYACPFHPRGTIPEFTREHPWRKPAPGMILAAADGLGLDLSRSWVIGDAERDVQAGIAAGIDASRCLRIGPSLSFREAVDTVLNGAG